MYRSHSVHPQSVVLCDPNIPLWSGLTPHSSSMHTSDSFRQGIILIYPGILLCIILMSSRYSSFSSLYGTSENWDFGSLLYNRLWEARIILELTPAQRMGINMILEIYYNNGKNANCYHTSMARYRASIHKQVIWSNLPLGLRSASFTCACLSSRSTSSSRSQSFCKREPVSYALR